MKNLLTTTLFLLASQWGQAAPADSTIAYLSSQDTVLLSIGGFGEKYFYHEMAPGQTLYSLARFYGLSATELQYYNPGVNPSALRLGTRVRVPVPNRAIRRYQPTGYQAADFVPVYYLVKKGDTMYRISKIHFRMPVEEMVQRNQLPDHTLRPGQRLHVGWLSLHGIPDSLRQGTGGPLSRRNHQLKKQYIYNMSGQREREHQGVAAWQTGTNTNGDFYALHRRAKVGSIVSVHNPMNRSTVYAKVVGRIPDRSYKDDVIVVLSPAAVHLLGAIDPRFFVRVKYHP